MAGAAILAFGFAQVGVSPLWLIVLGLLLGWFLNDRERKRIKREVASRRN
jgi:chromate transport protein ChrA